MGGLTAMVTGSRTMRQEDVRFVIEQVNTKRLAHIDTFVSGCAVGVDTIWALAAFACFPDKHHHLVVPCGVHNAQVVEMFFLYQKLGHNVTIEEMDIGTDFLDRDQRMVDISDQVHAFPRTDREQQRSGTWATVRRARKKVMPIYFYPLDLSDTWKEYVDG